MGTIEGELLVIGGGLGAMLAVLIQELRALRRAVILRGEALSRQIRVLATDLDDAKKAVLAPGNNSRDHR